MAKRDYYEVLGIEVMLPKKSGFANILDLSQNTTPPEPNQLAKTSFSSVNASTDTFPAEKEAFNRSDYGSDRHAISRKSSIFAHSALFGLRISRGYCFIICQIDNWLTICYYLITSPRSGRKTQRGVFIGANK